MSRKGWNQDQYKIRKKQFQDKEYQEREGQTFNRPQYQNNKNRQNFRRSDRDHKPRNRFNNNDVYVNQLKEMTNPPVYAENKETKKDFHKGQQHNKVTEKKSNDGLNNQAKIYQKQRLDKQMAEYNEQRIKAEEKGKVNQKGKSLNQPVWEEENLSFSQLRDLPKELDHSNPGPQLSFQFDQPQSFNKIKRNKRPNDLAQKNFYNRDKLRQQQKVNVIMDVQKYQAQQQNILDGISYESSKQKSEIMIINKCEDPLVRHSTIRRNQKKEKPSILIQLKEDDDPWIINENKKQQQQQWMATCKKAVKNNDIKVVSKFVTQKQAKNVRNAVKNNSNQRECIKMKEDKLVEKRQEKVVAAKEENMLLLDIKAKKVQQQKGFQQLINLNDSFDQIPIALDHFSKVQEKQFSTPVLQNRPRQQDVCDLIKAALDKPLVSVSLIFESRENVLQFLVKEIELVSLGVTVKLQSTGVVSVKKLQNFQKSQLQKYISFQKISHYFPRMGSQSSENLHYVQMVEDSGQVNPANCIEMDFCKIRANPQDFEAKGNSLIVRLVSIRCMQCQTKNEVVIADGQWALCSCRNCSAKVQGRIVRLSGRC